MTSSVDPTGLDGEDAGDDSNDAPPQEVCGCCNGCVKGPTVVLGAPVSVNGFASEGIQAPPDNQRFVQGLKNTAAFGAGLLGGLQLSTSPGFSVVGGVAAAAGPDGPAKWGLGVGLAIGGGFQLLLGLGGGAAAGGETWLTAGAGAPLTVPQAAAAAAIVENGAVSVWAGLTVLMSAAKGGGGGGGGIDQGKQDKHIPGTNNYIPGRSILTADPAELAKQAGTGRQIGNTPIGQPGSKEWINFGRVIGDYVDINGNSAPTTNGIIHYATNGFHIVPAVP